MSTQTTDVLVMGGGVIGASIAYECSKLGMKVSVLEKRSLSSGASGSSAAMLEFQLDAYRGEPFFTLANLSRQRFHQLSLELKDLTDDDIQYEECGILQLASTHADALYLEKEAERQNKLNLPCQWMDADSLQMELPILNPTHFGGILFKTDGQVNGEIFTAALMKAAQKKGAQFHDNLLSVELLLRDGKILGAKSKTDEFHAANVIIAAGAWTDQILKPLNIATGIAPVRGQLIIYDTPQRFLPYPIYTRSSGYITPKSLGYTLVGSTMEHVGFDESNTEKAKIDLQKMATDLIPNFARKNMRGMSAGLRPSSPDGLPVIGPLKEYPNVFVAAGHYRNGILLAPITGEIFGRLFTHHTLPLKIDSFSPSRFSESTFSII